MQWTLILILVLLMGHCSFSTCDLYRYYFIRETKTWYEAQMYCREKYTDLATVSDMRDMKRLCSSTENQDEAWIGLYNYSFPGNDTRTWYWSLPGLEFNNSDARWGSGQPIDYDGTIKNCVQLGSNNQQWFAGNCEVNLPFICYNETQQSNNRFYYSTMNMTWLDAQRYCRQNETDLVSGLDQLDDLPKTFTNNQWMGLFRDTWRWSDGSNSSFRNWQSLGDLVDGQRNKTCATVLNTTGTWSFDYCSTEKPFYCYGDNLILVKENKTWVEALNYCRDNYYDLVSITDTYDQSWVQEKVKNASTEFVWLGLRYSCTLGFWFWVSDEVVQYQNWASDVTSDDCDLSAAINTGDNTWVKKPDNETFNFICTKG